jgi:hypothetical protein
MAGQDNLPLRKMTTATARKLEALISMHQDLRRVMKLTHEAVELIKKNQIDSDILQSHWSEGLNNYARPFKDGVRQLKLDSKIFDGIEGAPESHGYFINQRDKLIAHSVNPFENVYVGVIVDKNGDIVGTGELAGKLVATSKEGFQDLNQLAKIATDYLKEEIDQSKKKLLEEASKLTKEQLLSLEIVKFTVPGTDAAAKGR